MNMINNFILDMILVILIYMIMILILDIISIFIIGKRLKILEIANDVKDVYKQSVSYKITKILGYFAVIIITIITFYILKPYIQQAWFPERELIMI